MKNLYILVLITLLLSGCAVGNVPFSERMDERIGTKVFYIDPTRYGDAGDLIRADYLVSGEGFTHISKNAAGDTIQHWFYSEVLSTNGNKEWVGKCKVIYVVDPQTNIIKSWAYDEGANPQSCRDWP
jgi:hypothetical protein